MDIFNPLIHQINYSEMIEMLLYIAGSILSLILVILSIYSYKRSGLKKLIYAVIAFSLFCMFLIYEGLEHFYNLDNPFTDIVIPSSGLAIIVFFFMAVIKRNNVSI